MKYAFIHAHRSAYGVEKMCRLLDVSRSGYYAWIDRPESRRSVENRELLSVIKQVHQDSREIYGSPKITEVLSDYGLRASRPRVARLMAQNGIRSKTKRKYRVTTHSEHDLPVSPNLLEQDFYVSAPGLIWVSDITYIRTQAGWLYLTIILDLFHRKVVGWSMSPTMTAEQTTLAALKQAYERNRPSAGLIFHSDRGIQYACRDFRQLLARYAMIQSMSGKGNCWDNAVAESFFKTLKTELVYHERYRSRQQARSSIFEYVEVFYNRIRKHSYLGYLSPEQYEVLNIKKAA